MKPRALDIKTHGDMGGTKVNMEFDSHSIAHIMSVLTDLYSDPELAILREYSTNAWDSHVEAGVTAPIEVSVGTSLDPMLVIQDFGVGLSVQELIEVYSKYGASTKRDTDMQIGMLGLGGKSALTYTNQFTVIAIKNGIKAVVLIGRQDDGSGMMEIIDTSATDEGNGVTIKIPLKRHNAVLKKAHAFFSYWPAGTVLLNGSSTQWKHFKEELVLSDNIKLVKVYDSNSAEDVIVMGNVPYKINKHDCWPNDNYYRYGLDSYYLVIRAKIGEVDFAPSRESLQYTDRTNKALFAYKEEIRGLIANSVQSKIDACLSHQEAFAMRQAWYRALGGNAVAGLNYRGESIPKIDSVWKFLPDNKSAYNTFYNPQNVADLMRRDTVFISNVPPRINTRDRSKIRGIYERDGLSPTTTAVGIDGCPKWIHFDYDWADIESFKRKPQSVSRLSTLQIKILDSRGYWTGLEDLDISRPVCFMAKDEAEDIARLDILQNVLGDAQVLMLGRNRWNKLKRDVPHAKHVHDVLKEKQEEFIAGLSKEDYNYFFMDKGQVNSYLFALDPAQINDPDLAELIKFMKYEPSSAIQSQYRALRNCCLGCFPGGLPLDKRLLEAYNRYVLLETFGYGIKKQYVDHLYIYINAVYRKAQ